MVCFYFFFFFFLVFQACLGFPDKFWSIYNHGHGHEPPLPNAYTENESISKTLRRLDESFSTCGPNSVEIREMTIEKAQALFHSGSLSSETLTKCYLDRIREMDPFLKAVIEINPNALSIATKADKERARYKFLYVATSPLHGIPIIIKDNIATNDGMQNTAGAVAMEGLIPKHDADVVRRLRLAGAIIIGRRNGLCDFRSTGIPNGWSGRGGQTLSPYNLTADPEGSSTGSGVAMSANFAVAALGSDTDGSIIAPSNFGSLVGLRPTFGLVPTTGVIPIAALSQDVVGPMTRTVRDAALLMEVISTSRHNLEGYLYEKKSWTIGILRNSIYWDTSDPLLAATVPILDASLTVLRKAGFKIVDPIPINASARLENVTSANELIVFCHEFKQGVNKYLLHDVTHKEDPKIGSLKDTIAFNNANPIPENYSQILLEAAQETDGLRNQTYLRARKINHQQSRSFIESVLKEFQLDAIASPCAKGNFQMFYSIGAFAGSPTISIPVGINANNQMPVGLCFSGRAHSDIMLLSLGKKVEEVFSNSGFGRRLPHFI